MNRKRWPTQPEVILNEYPELIAAPPTPQPPSVVSVIPIEDSVNISVDSEILVEFDQNIDDSTINSETFYLQKIDGGAILVPSSIEKIDEKNYKLVPDITLDETTQYRVTITPNVKNTLGIPLADIFSWDFSTETLVKIAGLNWTGLAKIEDKIISIEQFGQYIWLGTNNGKIYRTSDLVNFSLMTLSHTNSLAIWGIAAKDENNLLAISRDYTWTSTDAGLNWTRRVNFGTLSYCFALKKLNENIAIIARGYSRGIGTIVYFLDGAQVRTNVMQDTGLNGWNRSIAVINENICVFGTGETGNVHIHRTTDQMGSVAPKILEQSTTGNDWCQVDKSPDGSVYAIIPSATTNAVISKSTNNGSSFETIKDLGSSVIYPRFIVLNNESALYSSGNRVFRTINSHQTYNEITTLDGNYILVFYLLNNGSVLCGTDGSTTNLYISLAE